MEIVDQEIERVLPAFRAAVHCELLSQEEVHYFTYASFLEAFFIYCPHSFFFIFTAQKQWNKIEKGNKIEWVEKK